MSELLSRDDGRVRTLTLNRPPGNALNLALLASLEAAIHAAAEDDGVRAIIVDSSVDGYFSSGLDLQELSALPQSRRTMPFRALIAVYRALLSCPKPTVAALSGSALLGGWIIAMACDWRFAARETKISLSEIRLGLTPTPLLIERLRELSCDPRIVKEMVLRGRRLSSDEAWRAALIDEICPAATMKDAVSTFSRRFAASPKTAYARVKRSLAASYDDARWADSLKEFEALFFGAEAREGVAAATAKRRPRWEES